LNHSSQRRVAFSAEYFDLSAFIRVQLPFSGIMAIPDFKIYALIMALALCPPACQRNAPLELILFDFESDDDLNDIFWQCRALYSLSREHATHGASALKMELFPADYPGFGAALSARDWRRYRVLRFDVYNPSERTVPIDVRIDDRADDPENGDWFSKRFILRQGMNTIGIPFGALHAWGTQRPLDLEHIRKLFIYLNHPDGKNVLYIDGIKLTS
jgi:hypothetical protein